MTIEQEQQLQDLFGADIEIETINIVWDLGIEQVRVVAKSCDILIGVFPAHLLAKIAFAYGQACPSVESFAGKILIAESEPVKAIDGTVRAFKHKRFHRVDGYSPVMSSWLSVVA
jgi:hypothetical protein